MKMLIIFDLWFQLWHFKQYNNNKKLFKILTFAIFKKIEIS